MAKTITKETIGNITRLRDDEGLPWQEIGKRLSISRNTAKKHYTPEEKEIEKKEVKEEEKEVIVKDLDPYTCPECKSKLWKVSDNGFNWECCKCANEFIAWPCSHCGHSILLVNHGEVDFLNRILDAVAIFWTCPRCGEGIVWGNKNQIRKTVELWRDYYTVETIKLFQENPELRDKFF